MLRSGSLLRSVIVSSAGVDIRVLSIRITNTILRVAVLWFAVIAALAASPASAEVQAYYSSGNWTNYAGLGEQNAPMCLMSSTITSWGERRFAAIKYQADRSGGHLYVQLSVPRWRIRKGDTTVPFDIYFDRNKWIGLANSYGDGTTLFINIMPAFQEGFLHEVGEANTMSFSLGGNEWNWSFDMTGSRNAMITMRDCITKISAPPPPTYAQPAPPPTYAPAPQASAPSGKSSVPIYTDRGGAAVMVDVLLGGQPLRMTLDTGATMCTVTEAIAARIVSSGQGSWGEPVTSMLADGSKVTMRLVVIREMRIGPHVLRDVRAGVSSSQDMLLAFPAVNSIAPFTIDTRTRELVFHHGSAS